MRILQISSAREFGGGERHFVDLCRGLADRGHEVFAAIRPTSRWQDQLAFLPDDNILRVSIRNSFGILSATRIGAFARDRGIRLIHAHVARDYIPASIAASMTPDARFVLTRHLVFPLKPFNRFALKNLSRAIGVSDGVARSLKDVLPPEKVVVIRNGLALADDIGHGRSELRAGFRTRHGIDPDVFLIATLGTLLPVKGHDVFLRAAARIATLFPEVRFLVAGSEDPDQPGARAELERLAAQLGIADRVTFAGHLDDLAAFYSAIDVFVSASRSESFGLALLEAMMRGVPIVATATDGAAELLGSPDGLVAVGDDAALAERLGEMLRLSQTDRLAAANELRIRAETRFSLEQMIERTENLYRDVT